MADPIKHHPTLLLLEMEDLLHAVRLHLARRRPSGQLLLSIPSPLLSYPIRVKASNSSCSSTCRIGRIRRWACTTKTHSAREEGDD
jgi:hypothetical protein